MTQHISLTVLSINAALQIASACVVALGLMIGLLLIDWQVALSTAFVFGISYGVVAITARRQLSKNSERIALANTQRVQALQEGLGAIRDVLLDGNQATYLNLYRRSDTPSASCGGQKCISINISALFPRGSWPTSDCLTWWIVGASEVAVSMIPLPGVLALCTKVASALQLIYSGWANLKSWSTSFAAVVQMLEQPYPKIKNLLSLLFATEDLFAERTLSLC